MQPLFTDPPLATWRPFNHLGALRQIFLLYRKPKTFAAQLSNCPDQTTTALTLMLHALPWLIGAITLGRLLWQTPDLSILPVLGGTALGLAVGCTWALGLGFNRGRHNLLTLAIPGMLTMGFIGGVAGDFTYPIATTLLLVMLMNATEHIGTSINEHWRISLTMLLPASMAYLSDDPRVVLVTAFVLLTPTSLLHLLGFSYPSPWRARWYRVHPVAWYDHCEGLFWGLPRLLVEVWQKNPTQGRLEIERIIAHSNRRQEGLKALAMIQLREAAEIKDLAELQLQLPDDDHLFPETPKIHQLAQDLARQAGMRNRAKQPAMRRAADQLTRTTLAELEKYLARLPRPVREESNAALQAWGALIATNETAQPGPIPALFHPEGPLDAESDPYVHRVVTVRDIEVLSTPSRRCPCILLTGPSGSGKTTLLHNLHHFLPDNYLILHVKRQGRTKDLQAFTGHLRAQVQHLPLLAQAPLGETTELMELLAQWNRGLGPEQRLLLILDDLQDLDQQLAAGDFPAAFTEILRASFQQHTQLTWLCATHQALDTFASPLAALLSSCETLELPSFNLNEATLLLTDPLMRSPFWGPRPDRPRLAHFWAASHIERIHAHTGGQPDLVQKTAQAVIDQANAQGLKQTTDDVINQALGATLPARSLAPCE